MTLYNLSDTNIAVTSFFIKKDKKGLIFYVLQISFSKDKKFLNSKAEMKWRQYGGCGGSKPGDER